MSVTTSNTDVWELVYDDLPNDEFPDGLRLSTDCVCCRLIAPLDPDRFHEFPAYLGYRGHGFERIMQEWLLNKFGVSAIREVVVPWEYGESHLDLFMSAPQPAFDVPNGRPLQVELKANVDGRVKAENIRQVQRQMFAVERAAEQGRMLKHRARRADGEWSWGTIDPAVYADAEWRVVVIDPATWRVPSPEGVRVNLTDERRAELAVEWEQMTAFMQLPASKQTWDIEWESRMPKCTCGKAFRPELEELDHALVEHAQMFMHAHDEVKDAEAEKAIPSRYLRSQLEPKAPPGEGASWAGGGFKVTLTKPNKSGTRSLLVTRSDAKPRARL